MSMLGEVLIFNGREFHRTGAAEAKERRPKEARFHLGMCRRHLSEERRVRDDERGVIKFLRYCGASPFNALYVISKSLNTMRWVTGSH